MSIDLYLHIDFQTLGTIFSFIVVIMMIKWGIDEGIREKWKDKAVGPTDVK